MTIEEKFKRDNLIMQEKVKEEIEKVTRGASSNDLIQLNAIAKELIKMQNEKQLAISFPHFIIDSWDYQDELGIELMVLADLYTRWK